MIKRRTTTTMLDFAERGYGIVLGFYPKVFRRRYGPSMIEVFRAQCEHLTRLHGASAWRIIFLRNMTDILSSALRQRVKAFTSTVSRCGKGLFRGLERRCGSIQSTPWGTTMHIETKGDFMDTLTSDIRFALRTFKRSPGVITAAVVSLALGIGANVTIFSATDVCIFRPLPYEEADRLLHVFQIHPGARAERFDEAARHFEECRRRKYPFYASYSQLAASYMGLGRFEEGKRVMVDYLEQNPSQAAAHYTFASYLTRGGRLEEALETLEKAESLGAFPFFSTGVLWTVSVLRDDLEGAEKIARQGRMSENRDERFFGSRQLAITRIIQGRSEDALAILNETEQIFSEPDNRTAFAHNTTAHILIDQGQPKPALEQAQKAQIDGKGDYPEWEGLFLASLALVKLGRWEDAEKTAETLQLKAESLPTEKEKRRYHHLIGELTLLRGDARTAVRELENAEAMLPAGALDLEYRLAQHVPIWYSLARAYLASGDEAKATIWFERIAESG